MVKGAICVVCAFLLLGCSQDKSLDKVESAIESLKDETQHSTESTKKNVNEAKLEPKQNKRTIKEAIATQTLEA